MRTGWPPCVLAIVLVSTWSARAEPATSTITVPDVLVRSGPSPDFYPTSRLRRGDKVRVVREEATGWLAIAPPPGSFSYIEARLVEWIGRNAAVVSAPEAQIWVASELVHTKPTVSLTKVKRGTQVTITGKIQQTPYEAWLSILPVPLEVRYIPAEAIRPVQAQQQTIAAAPQPNNASRAPANSQAAPAFSAVQPAAGSNSPLPPQAPSHTADQLWLQAEEEERTGNVVRAKELYQELAEQVKATDHNLWVRCLNRVQALQDRRADGFAALPPGANANSYSATARNRLVPTPGCASARIACPRGSSEYCYLPDSRYTARLSAPIASTPSPPTPSGQWFGPGWLSRTAFSPDGKPLFCLQPLGANKRHIYVSPGANVSLEPYVNRNVYLYGPMVYNGDLRTYYMTVLKVSLLR